MNILGPYDSTDWTTMLVLRRSIRYFKKKVEKSDLYLPALRKEQACYEEYLRRVA